VDEDFDTASFDEAYDISDFGEGQAFSMDDRAPVTTMFGGGDFVDAGLGDDGDSLSSILNPALGSGNRTNITNVGGGSNLVYDPAFAAAIDIRRGIDPTNNLGGTGGVMVPASLRPQIQGEFYDPFGDKPMFFSQGEKFFQETLPGIVQTGPVARIARGVGSFLGNLFSEGKEFARDATGGIKLPSLQDISEGFTNFMGRFRPQRTVTRPDERAVMGSLNPTDRFPSDMRQVPMSTFPITGGEMMNTGIASMRPQQMQDADRNVVDALQLIPSNLETNPMAPISKVKITDPVGISSALPTERDREKRDFARDIFEAFPDQRTRQFGPKDRLASINEEYFNRVKNKEPFVDTGNFIVLD
jgi:hypothetical protein